MDLDFSPEDQAFREEVRAWMRANVPPKAGPEIGLPSHLETQAAWERKLGKQGWLAYNWPILPGRRRIKELYFFKNTASAAGFIITVVLIREI